MRLLPIALPLALALAAAAGPAIAQPAAGNAEPLAAERAFNDAQVRRDRAALQRLIAPDFLIARASGRVGNRGDFIEGVARPGVTVEPFAIASQLFLRPSADVAIVGGEARVRGSEDGRRFASHYRFSHTFARRDGRWVLVYAHVTGLPD